jgi:hypothetical protein
MATTESDDIGGTIAERDRDTSSIAEMERDKPPFSVGIDIQNIQAPQASSTPHSPRM